VARTLAASGEFSLRARYRDMVPRILGPGQTPDSRVFDWLLCGYFLSIVLEKSSRDMRGQKKTTLQKGHSKTIPVNID
jgi:hypothetical protein